MDYDCYAPAVVFMEVFSRNGVDVAFEVCGAVAVVGQAVRALRIGGRYLIAGFVMPGSNLDIDGNQVTRKCLTIKGIHDYKLEHLGKAIRFLEKRSERIPYKGLVDRMFTLAEINEAIQAAASGKYVRVAIRQAQ